MEPKRRKLEIDVITLSSSEDEQVDGPGLLMHNPDTNCFVIVVVNILFRIFGKNFPPYDPKENPMTTILRNLFNLKSNDVSQLRDLFRDKNLHKGEHGAGDSLEEIVKNLPSQCLAKIEMMTGSNWQCSKCDDGSENRFRTCHYMDKQIYSDIKLEDLFEYARDDKRPCKRCADPQHKYIFHWPEGDFVIIKMSKASDHLKIDKGDEQNNVKVGKEKWPIIAAIEYLKNNCVEVNQIGHYVSWLKDEKNGLWYRYSDHHVQQRQKFNIEDLHLSVVVLQRPKVKKD